MGQRVKISQLENGIIAYRMERSKQPQDERAEGTAVPVKGFVSWLKSVVDLQLLHGCNSRLAAGANGQVLQGGQIEARS